MTKLRKYNAEYYDAFESYKDDISFYESFVSKNTKVLELGCGTGRVTFPLAKKAKQVVGVDISEEMILKAKNKLKDKSINFILGDITSLKLNDKFNLIIAPFRVFQSLETESERLNLLKTIEEHLDSKGLVILNIFNPYLNKEDMKTKWLQEGEINCGEAILENGDVLKHSEARKHLDVKNQIFYVDLIYRRYRNNKLVDEHINPICMKYYYPDEFKNLISQNGFVIKNCWGGYKGEIYGQGPELVVSFIKE